MLFLNNAGHAGKYSKGTLAHGGVIGLACLEQGAEKFHPYLACGRKLAWAGVEEDGGWQVPLSMYCLAISAMASPILFLTERVCSLARLSSNLERMAMRASALRVRKSSLDSPEVGLLRVLEDCLRKSTAAKDLVCKGLIP